MSTSRIENRNDIGKIVYKGNISLIKICIAIEEMVINRDSELFTQHYVGLELNKISR